MITINKEKSGTRVEILKMNGTAKPFLAAKVCGQDHDQVFLNSRWFTTETGARRWAIKVLA